MSEGLERWITDGQTVVPNGLLIHYRAIGINDSELVFLIQLESLLRQGNRFPNIAELADRMGKSEAELFTMLHGLIQKKLMVMETQKDETGRMVDSYSLLPLYKRIEKVYQRAQKAKTTEQEDVNLLEIFQQEFGRLLTPIEMQTIACWLDTDGYSKELILEALREAVLSQSYSLKYMDRILLTWEKKNIKTHTQAKQHTKQFQQSKGAPMTEEADADFDIPLFNWLENES